MSTNSMREHREKMLAIKAQKNGAKSRSTLTQKSSDYGG